MIRVIFPDEVDEQVIDIPDAPPDPPTSIGDVLALLMTICACTAVVALGFMWLIILPTIGLFHLFDWLP